MRVISHDLKTEKLSCYCFNDVDVRNEIPISEIKDSLLLIALIISSSSVSVHIQFLFLQGNWTKAKL